ncbi:MAG: hypothetical protein V4558_09185 [Gemmatimonadota bacterium]
MTRAVALFALCATAVTPSLAAQQPALPPVRRLVTRAEEFPQPFTSVRSLTALPDGRLVLSDAAEKKLLLVDFAKKSATPLARPGTGPREFQDPGGTYRAARGGVIVYDQRQKRFLPIAISGQVGDVVALPMTPSSWGASDEGPDTFVPDSLGNLYTLGSRFTRAGPQDSIPLIHIDRRGVTSDTLGFLKQQESRPLPSSQPGVTMGRSVMFSPQDVWAVAPDGAVAVVKAAPYRVDWVTPGKPRVVGASIPFTPLRVTGADRDSIKARSAGSSASVSRNGQSSRVQTPTAEPITAEVKPPFPAQVPRIDEMGRLWVERSRTADATTRTYDVFDRRGALVDRLELPAGARLVGFDAHSLYTVRKDDDDLLHLQRFKLP